jgi:hypothetical protein
VTLDRLLPGVCNEVPLLPTTAGDAAPRTAKVISRAGQATPEAAIYLRFFFLCCSGTTGDNGLVRARSRPRMFGSCMGAAADKAAIPESSTRSMA